MSYHEIKVEDTSLRNPADHLLGAALEGHSNYIENMEAKGQREVVRSNVLPHDTGGTDAEFEALGFVFGKLLDPLFRETQLPEGWYKRADSHDMWSYVVDAEGVDRVAVFYKAAFYDRRAHMYLIEPKDAA